MVKEYKGQDESNWLDELVYRLTYDIYRNSYRELYFRIKDIITDLTPRLFNDIIDLVHTKNYNMFHHDLPQETMNFIYMLNFVRS